MNSKYFITYRQQEQAERMAGKWKARAEAWEASKWWRQGRPYERE